MFIKNNESDEEEIFVDWPEREYNEENVEIVGEEERREVVNGWSWKAIDGWIPIPNLRFPLFPLFFSFPFWDLVKKGRSLEKRSDNKTQKKRRKSEKEEKVREMGGNPLFFPMSWPRGGDVIIGPWGGPKFREREKKNDRNIHKKG